MMNIEAIREAHGKIPGGCRCGYRGHHHKHHLVAVIAAANRRELRAVQPKTVSRALSNFNELPIDYRHMLLGELLRVESEIADARWGLLRGAKHSPRMHIEKALAGLCHHAARLGIERRGGW